MYPDDRKYSKEHEWVIIAGDEAKLVSPTTRRSSW